MDESTRQFSIPARRVQPLRFIVQVWIALLVWTLLSPALVNGQESASDESRQHKVPEWVERGSYVEGDCEFVLVATERGSQYGNLSQVSMAIDPLIKIAVAKKIDEWFGAGAGAIAAIEDPSVLAKLVPENRRHNEGFDIPLDEEDAVRFGTKFEHFYRGYALLELDNEFRASVEKTWRRNRTRNRLIYTASIGAAILGVLGVAYGFLHVNHLTRGFYIGRLQLFAVGLIVAVIAISYYAARVLVP